MDCFPDSIQSCFGNCWTTNQTIAFNPDCAHQIDIADFVTVIKNADYTQAVDLYRGPFLAEFEALDSDLFESWVETQRENLHRHALDAFRKLSLEHEQKAELDQARKVVNQLLTMAPWQEEAHAQLMRLLALSGERSAALAQYDTLSQMLMDELGVSPSDETNTLYDQILAGDLTTSSTPSPSHPLTQSPLHLPAPFQVTAPSPHFVGRAEEIAQVRQLLNQPGSTIVALVGMGGLGKTTLATQVAHAIRDDFPDGVLWANPAISSIMDILDNWAKAYGYDFSGLSDIESRGAALRGVLAEKSELMVLDNVTSTSQVKPVMVGGKGSPILITTRDLDVAHALNAEVIPLGELSVESGRDLLVNILGQERVTAEEEAVDQICQLLHYLPLAVEIAAQRLKSRTRMTLGQMAQRLSDTGQRLGLKISDQAVRTSFEVSWEALDEELQRFFPLVAVFEGRPFTVAALAYVAEMDEFDVEDLLYGLNALSLVNEDEAAYFRQHPLLADFAKAKLESSAYHQQHETIADLAGEKLVVADQAYGRLVEYYLAFVKENQENYELLEPEWANIGIAIVVGERLERWEQVVAFSNMLSQTWMTRARFDEAKQAYALVKRAAEQIHDQMALALTMLRWGEICIEQSSYVEAKALLDHSLELYESQNELGGIGDVKFHLGAIALEQSRLDAAETLVRECLGLRHSLKDQKGIAEAHTLLANIVYDRDAFEEARDLAASALVIQEEFADGLGMIRSLRLLSNISARLESYDEAVTFGQKALDLATAEQNDHEAATCLYALASILRYQRKFEAARIYVQDALMQAIKLGLRRLEGQLQYQLGVIYKELEEFQPALTCIEDSITVFEQLDDHLGRAYSLIQAGDLYHFFDDKLKAQGYWTEAQQIGQTVNNPWVQQETTKRLTLL